MPTILTHAAVGLAVGRAFRPAERDARFWWTVALLPVLADADVVGFPLGIRYGDPWGHRGASHSLVFAAALAAAGLARLRVLWRGRPREGLRLLLPLFVAAASHGPLDALTDGGLGIALLWPFDDARYFSPFRPLAVAPIGLPGVFSPRFLAVLASEFLWVWLPAGAALAALNTLRAEKRYGVRHDSFF